ncbi:MAG TPA: hypothetical protein VHO47_00355 [Candidatus Babeliales bacterium]|nr:hypothetical protein [Candidatus Babeliales bacterium]
MKIKKLCLLLLLVNCQPLLTISLVYNMKIRRVFNVGAILGKSQKTRILATAVPIFYKRDREFVDPVRAINFTEKRSILGSLFNLRVTSPKSAWWGEITAGVENEHFKTHGSQNLSGSRTGGDDIVFSAGHNWFPNKKTQVVFYGIGGFPTNFKVDQTDINDPLVGTRFFSAGFGSELSYDFIASLRQSCIIIFQNRFLHFFDRSWPFPLVGSRVQPGNVIDVLLSLQYRIKRTLFEGGYGGTYFTNQAAILPNQKINAPAYVRNSGYITFTHLIKHCPGFKIPLLIGAGFSGGTANLFKTRIISGWVTLSTIF